MLVRNTPISGSIFSSQVVKDSSEIRCLTLTNLVRNAPLHAFIALLFRDQFDGASVGACASIPMHPAKEGMLLSPRYCG